MRKRRLSPLPLPRSWLTFSPPESEVTDRETVLAGKELNTGTKASLRAMLLNKGWDADVIEPVLAGKFSARDYLVDLVQEERKDFDFNAALLRLKEAGFKSELVAKTGASRAAQEVWDSFTRTPWWVSALRGNRTIVLSAKTLNAARRASASFVRDLWVNLGEAPESRLPAVRRVNLLGFTSADGVKTFRESVAKTTGLIVAHGLETTDFIYQMFGYAAALSEVAPHATLVYEVVPSPDVTATTVVSAAQRAGFSMVFGVRRG